MKKDIKSIYKKTDKDFYHDQTVSKNPLRKQFHLNGYRIANSLVKSKYKDGKKIVDFGCGSCDWNLNNLPVFGLDLNEGLLKVGKQKNRLYDYKVSDVINSGLPDGSFDIVTMFGFLEHLKDYKKTIKESLRLLKKGGYCIVSVPYGTVFSLWRPLFFIQVFFQGYVLQKAYYKQRRGHINHFSPEKIKRAFLIQGYEVELVFDVRRLTIFLCLHKKGENVTSANSYDDVTIILPTLNEEKNISYILKYLISHYKDSNIIISDDGSQDNTKNNAMALKYKRSVFLDRSKRQIHGLTASVLDATELVKTKYFVVIDADGQHPPEKIKEIVNILRSGSRLVIASRVEVEEEWGLVRKTISYIGTLLGKTVLLLKGKNYISYDILGGFFGCNTKFWNRAHSNRFKKSHFRLEGYKVLFDFLKYLPSRTGIEEVYYRFKTRKSDVSKLSLKVHLEYFKSCFLP